MLTTLLHDGYLRLSVTRQTPWNLTHTVGIEQVTDTSNFAETPKQPQPNAVSVD